MNPDAGGTCVCPSRGSFPGSKLSKEGRKYRQVTNSAGLFRAVFFGAATAILYISLGSVFVVTFFFIGQAAGFAEPLFTLKFVLLVLYVSGTFVLATWLAWRPSVLRGVLLRLLSPLI